MNNFLQIPHLGYAREFNHKLFQSLDAWLNLQQANLDYQLVLLAVWGKAVEEFLRSLNSDDRETVRHWQEFLLIWSQIFDRIFAQTFRADDALRVRGKFLNALMLHRRQQQQLLEIFLKLNDLPTRSEVDELHRNLYELRKELKTLKRGLGKV